MDAVGLKKLRAGTNGHVTLINFWATWCGSCVTEFADLQWPLVTNVDADTEIKGSEARDALIRQVTMPVRWEESVRTLIDEGVNTFVEVGPGRVLTGLLRQIERSVATLNIEDQKSLAMTVDKITGAKSDAA